MRRPLTIALIHDVVLPTPGYGGTERVIWWLAKGLAERGHRVVLAARRGSRCPFAEVVNPDFSRPIPAQLAADVYHFHAPRERYPSEPHVVTIHGNGKPGEEFSPNACFVSRNHAERHGATAFVYNGVDPGEYRFESRKDPRLLFLARASWKVKNVSGAIRIARAAELPLEIVGGNSPWSWWWKRRGIFWRGTVGGESKRELLARARGLLFPVQWQEPFGIAVVEALISGTPVLASPFGSLPELVPAEVGRLCSSEEQFVEAAGALEAFSAERCREWALERFHYGGMTEGYLGLYRQVLDGETLNSSAPRTTGSPTDGCRLSSRTS